MVVVPITESGLGNHELLVRFECDTDPDVPFHHADHVRLAFAYLSCYPVLQALEKFSAGLQKFAARRGKTELYHETITCSYFFLIHERMARHPGINWNDFATRNADLLVWKDGVLSRYYEKATLNSDLARRVFILPDKSLPQASG